MDGAKPRRIGFFPSIAQYFSGVGLRDGGAVAGPKPSPQIRIREMTVAHVDGVSAIEERSFPTPWSRHAFISEITENSMADYVVALAGQEVVGYGGMWTVFDEAHITNIAVAPEWRRLGIGSMLLRELALRARAKGVNRMTLEVRVSNYPARHLYEKFGFVRKGLRRGYYADTQEDAIIMWLDDLQSKNL